MPSNNINIYSNNTQFIQNYFNKNCLYEQKNIYNKNYNNFIKIISIDKIIIINLKNKIQIYFNNKFININKFDTIYFKNVNNLYENKYLIILNNNNTNISDVIFNSTNKNLFINKIETFINYLNMEYNSPMNILD